MELQTQRLFIRPLAESDFPAFEKTLNQVQKTALGSAKGFFDWITAQYEKMDILHGLISLGVFDKNTGELLGTAGAGRHDDLGEPEIFYHLLPEHRGRGYATEAARAVTSWAVESYRLPYLIGTAGVENIKSQKVLERCGYRLIDTRTLLVHAEGKQYDFKYYRFYPPGGDA